MTHTGRYRRLLVVGSLLLALGNGLFLVFAQHTSQLVQACVLVLCGLGAGAVIQPLMMAAQAAVDGRDMAAATTLCAFLRSLGGIICVAVLSSVGHSVVRQGLARVVAGQPSAVFVVVRVAENQAAVFAPGVPDALRSAVVAVFAKAMHVSFVALLPFGVLLLVVCLAFEHIELNRERKQTIDTHACVKKESNDTRPSSSSSSSSANKPSVDWDRTLNEAIEQAKRELSQSSHSSSPSSSNHPQNSQEPEDPNEPQEDYLVTLGRVMDELPRQIEGFFAHGLDSSIYCENVCFREPRHSGMQVTGRAQYMGVARVLRIAMNAYYVDPLVSIVGIRQVPVGEASDSGSEMGSQEKDAGGGSRRFDVFVRWVFEGVPRHAELLGNATPSRFEGEFRYAIHHVSGLVAEHEVTAIHPAPPTAVLASSGLARWMGWLTPRGMPPVAGST
ncbi:hypothetical protein LPJ73_002924 [Coemansia sp. RSA 2703]|nr:hypothetical protein LPJ73_002924 [Coemansia sp. RSA 2703]